MIVPKFFRPLGMLKRVVLVFHFTLPQNPEKIGNGLFGDQTKRVQKGSKTHFIKGDSVPSDIGLILSLSWPVLALQKALERVGNGPLHDQTGLEVFKNVFSNNDPRTFTMFNKAFVGCLEPMVAHSPPPPITQKHLKMGVFVNQNKG